jgi:hypothetical protein
MNDIKKFYLNIATIENLPTFKWVMNADTGDLEDSHNWCQRAFPNFEPSEVVPGSPVLDEETLAFIKKECKEQVQDLVFKFLRHYDMLGPHRLAHNNRRVTRLIKFLAMLEYDTVRDVVFSHCHSVLLENFQCFTGMDKYVDFHATVQFWKDAKNYKRDNNDSNTQRSSATVDESEF